MPTPSPTPTVFVVMERSGGFWDNQALVTLAAVFVGGLISYLAQRAHAKREYERELAKEFREVRRGLYARVALTFDSLNHLILEWRRLDDIASRSRTKANREKEQVGLALVEKMNDMTALATEVGISGRIDIADFLHSVASRGNIPGGIDDEEDYRDIQGISSSDWEEFRQRLLVQREDAYMAMREDLEFLGMNVPAWMKPLAFIAAMRDRRRERRNAESKASAEEV